MHIRAFVSAVFFVFLSVPGSADFHGSAFADAACVVQPDRSAPQGRHWYFHSDREKNRKCWYLLPAATAAPAATDDVPAPERSRSFASSVNSAFSSLVREMRSFFRKPMPHERTAGEPRIIQSDATKPLTIEDIAQRRLELPEEQADARPGPVVPLGAARRRTSYDDYTRWEVRNAASTIRPAGSP